MLSSNSTILTHVRLLGVFGTHAVMSQGLAERVLSKGQLQAQSSAHLVDELDGVEVMVLAVQRQLDLAISAHAQRFDDDVLVHKCGTLQHAATSRCQGGRHCLSALAETTAELAALHTDRPRHARTISRQHLDHNRSPGCLCAPENSSTSLLDLRSILDMWCVLRTAS